MAQPSQEVRDLIGKAIQHKRKKDSEVNLGKIAGTLGISEARLSSYNTGVRIPPKPVTEKLAKYFFQPDSKEYQQFVAAMNKAREESRLQGRSSRGSILERLSEGEKLRVHTSRSMPFSGDDGFIDQLFQRFFRLSNLNQKPIPLPGLDIHNDLWKNKLDLWLSCLSSVNRSVLAHFWPTPIRLSLGALIHSKHASEQDRVKRILCNEEARGNRIRPIIVRGELGAIHCLNTLDFKETEVTFEEHLDPEELAEALIEMSLAQDDEIPVLVVDEHSTFQVLRLLGKEVIPVIPLSSWYEVRHDRARRELPQYFLSFACSRRQEELSNMIEHAFFLFLATELETTANALASLYRSLMKELDGVAEYYFPRRQGLNSGHMEQALRFQHARGWTLYSLCLDKNSLENYPRGGMPWWPILHRTRQIIHDELANPKNEEAVKTLNTQIEFFADYKDGALSDKQFRKLCRALDLPEVNLNFAQRQYILEDRHMVLEATQNALHGEPVPPIRPKIEILTPIAPDDKRLSIVAGSLGEMAKMYTRELGEKNLASMALVELLENSSAEIPRFFGVALAHHGTQHRHYIGCVCLIKDDARPNDLELRYIWVLERFRRLTVGEHLLREVWKFAQNRFEFLVVEVLPQYLEGILYYEKRGFTQDSTRHGTGERIVLVYPTSQNFPDPDGHDKIPIRS